MILGGFLFLVGLVIGSGINSYLWRYQTKLTFKGRSICPACRHKLAWYDNIPLVSWFLLSGKCRYCKKTISVQYPIVELLTGVAFLLVGIFSDEGFYIYHVTSAMFRLLVIISPKYFFLGVFELLIALSITTTLIAITVYDYKTKEIPNGFNLIFFLLALVYLIVNQIWKFNLYTIGSYLISAIVAFLFFYAFVFFSHETWMGGGDAKMAAGMGLLLGPAGTFLAILIASISGSVFGISQILIQNHNDKKSMAKKSKINKGLKTQVPFGPFLALGAYVSLVFGAQIIEWYVKMFTGL